MEGYSDVNGDDNNSDGKKRVKRELNIAALRMFVFIMGIIILSTIFPGPFTAIGVYGLCIIAVWFLRRREKVPILVSMQKGIWGHGFIVGGGISILVTSGLFTIFLLTGMVYIDGVREDANTILIFALLLQLLVGIGEEMSFREYIMRNLTASIGIKKGVLLSAAGFTVAHIPSYPYIEIPILLKLMLTCSMFIAGIVLGLLYIRFGLSATIGFHTFWNLMIYHVLSLNPMFADVSILKLEISAHDFIFGGNFGPEAGLSGILVLLSLTIVLSARLKSKKFMEANEKLLSLGTN